LTHLERPAGGEGGRGGCLTEIVAWLVCAM
jgi:hypothetical protein